MLIKCDFCNKSYNKYVCIMNHRKHNFCCIKCKAEWQKINLINDKNPFYNKKHSNETKEKIRNSRIERRLSIGKNNPMYGKHHNEKTIIKISKKAKQRHENGYVGNFYKGNTLWDNESAINTRFKKGHRFSGDIKEKMITNQRKSMIIKPNKPEKILINLFQENNLPFNYVGDGKIWIRSGDYIFNPDFISLNNKKIIELYGDYWHNLTITKKRDEKRIETYLKNGYKTLIIWENELNNNIENLLIKIKEFLR